MKYTAEQVEAMAAKLRQLPPAEKKTQDFSRQETVKLLAKEIAALQRRGYTLEAISESLRGVGLDILTPTLKNYLQRARPGKKKTVRAAPAEARSKAPVASAVGKAPSPAAAFTPKPDSSDI